MTKKDKRDLIIIAILCVLSLTLFGLYVASLVYVEHYHAPAINHQSLVKPAIVEKPVTSKAEFTSQNITPPAPVKSADQVVISETPLPPVDAQPMPQDFKRSDGFDNMCYKMDDGSWTTTIMKDYTLGPDLYPYKGDIDPATEAPATAKGSQAWCLQNAP